MDRRKFIEKSTILSGAAGAALTLPVFGCKNPKTNLTETPPSKNRTLIPRLVMNGTAAVSKPDLSPSQLSFRIGLARKRMASYPCDKWDFILMDLEQPENKRRKASNATGDLTGRLLEFLSCSEGIDGINDPRLDTLFEKILEQKKPSGYVGRLEPPRDDLYQGSTSSKVFHGMIRYYELTGDKRALDTALGMAEILWKRKDKWETEMKSEKGISDILTWIGEPFARLYNITGDKRWMDFLIIIRDNLRPIEGRRVHTHGLLSTLRGLQVMAILTGDFAWNALPDKFQKIIIENHLEMPDGCIPEFFPPNERNEGCSIADWMMLNLNQGFINGDDNSYDKAERVFWNALAFNQLITGGFGHREIASNGYGTGNIQEAWWCCTQDAGMGMSDLARHAVTFRNNSVNVNFLIPGVYELPLPGNTEVKLRIDTSYPSKAMASIEVEGIPDNIDFKIRVPYCVRNPKIETARNGKSLKAEFSGDIGHRIEKVNQGVILTYGPLLLVPTRTVRIGSYSKDSELEVIKGYDPQSMPAGLPIILLDSQPDTNGFVDFPLCPPEKPVPAWNYFFEGHGSPTWVEGSGVDVGLKFPNGEKIRTRFTPMCYNTSCLSLFDTPVVYSDVE